MPAINLAHVVSFSSEDPVHKATNVLSPAGDKKFKCARAGESHVSVVVQLEKSTAVSQIDLGNDGAAFIEVQVGRKEDPLEEFKTILPSASFMSPLEARNEKCQNRVRMFNLDKLNREIAGQKWDRIKIICTQPFNKHVKYGLAFITLTAPTEGEENKRHEKGSKLGAFTIKDDSDSDSTMVGNLFARKLKPSESSPNTSSAAAELRSKETLATMALKNSASVETNRPMFYQLKKEEQTKKKPKDSGNGKLPARNVLPGETKRKKDETPKKSSDEKTPKRKRLSEPSSGPSTVASKKPKIGKPFTKLMEGVFFAISGIQNPTRGIIRQQALEMGAKYRPDWDGTCTHLICAFMNTPKFNQVKGKGKIVTSAWIDTCHKERKRIPWRRFALDPKDKKQDESEDEIWDETLIEKKPEKLNKTPKKEEEEEMDTDDELEAFKKENVYEADTDNEEEKSDKSDDEAYDADTDVDDDNESAVKKKSPLKRSRSKTEHLEFPELPNFFEKTKFFFFGTLSPSVHKDLKRKIVASGGQVEQYMSSDINFVITEEDWSKNFDDALKENGRVKFVKSRFIDACWKDKKLVNYATYKINRNN